VSRQQRACVANSEKASLLSLHLSALPLSFLRDAPSLPCLFPDVACQSESGGAAQAGRARHSQRRQPAGSHLEGTPGLRPSVGGPIRVMRFMCVLYCTL